MQLDETVPRRLVNVAVARARAYERERFAAQAEQLRAEMKATISAECDALRAELKFLREYFNAHVQHALAKQDVLNVLRRHAIARAQEATRDESTVLQ